MLLAAGTCWTRAADASTGASASAYVRIGNPMYVADVEIPSTAAITCWTPAAAPYADHCLSQAELLRAVEAAVLARHPGCQLVATEPGGAGFRSDPGAGAASGGDTVHARLDYGNQDYLTVLDCPGRAQPKATHAWRMRKLRRADCALGHVPIAGMHAEATLAYAAHCKPARGMAASASTRVTAGASASMPRPKPAAATDARPYSTLSEPSYLANLGPKGFGSYGCQPAAMPPYQTRCLREEGLILAVERKLLDGYGGPDAGCRVVSTTVRAGEFDAQPQSTPTRLGGTAHIQLDYGKKYYRSEFSCIGRQAGQPVSHVYLWTMTKQRQAECPAGTRGRIGRVTTPGALEEARLCRPG